MQLRTRRWVLPLAISLAAVASAPRVGAQGDASSEPPARWWAHAHLGGIVIPSIEGIGTYNQSLAAGYALDARHAVGLALRRCGYSGAYNNAGAVGAGLRYRVRPWRWLAASAEGGLVLAGTRGGDFTTSEPAGAGGGYWALHLDYVWRFGLTAGVYAGAARGFRTEQEVWDWDTDGYVPAGVNEGEFGHFGLAVGWTLPR